MVNGRQILIPVRQGVRTVVAEVTDTVQLVTVLMGVCFYFLTSMYCNIHLHCGL